MCAVLALAGAPAAAQAARCHVPGARVWTRDAEARLLVRTARHGRTELYACTRRRGARRVGGVMPPASSPGPLLAGRWTLFEAGHAWGSALVRVDLRTGRRRVIDRLYARYTLHTSNGWVLTRAGSVAWVSDTDVYPPGDQQTALERRVSVTERGRRARTVDEVVYHPFSEPVPIPDASLRLGDVHTLRWTSAGQVRSASIR
jgi:hypothetical protein